MIEQVKEKLKEIKKDSFPPGMDFEVSYDVSSFLEASIEKVVHTLWERRSFWWRLVVFLFLGDWRSTLIPTLAVPVSLIGTFFFMLLFGLSINLITLFALVLAIGVVVDDAIVVVEAVHAKMAEKHLSPYRATREVVHEISGAIIAITMVMTAVFIPVTFMTWAGRCLLSPVRAYDGHVDRPLWCCRFDAHAGPLRHASQTAQGPYVGFRGPLAFAAASIRPRR